ncbi:MAG: hypothetical protein HYV36_05795 [Lentisphaerae bacterium]|nr:hypothetical protein [Lentisphaerota bacterium]
MTNHEQGGEMNARAFTLVEVVIAIVLLVMALSLFVGSFVGAKRSAVIADNRLEAVHNARAVLENTLGYAYGTAQLSNGLHGTSISGLTYYVVTVTQAPNIVVKNIYVTNRWVNPASGATSTVSLAGSMSSELHP